MDYNKTYTLIVVLIGSTEGSICSTCSNVSNSYENDPNYTNTPLNYESLIVEGQNSLMKRLRVQNNDLHV